MQIQQCHIAAVPWLRQDLSHGSTKLSFFDRIPRSGTRVHPSTKFLLPIFFYFNLYSNRYSKCYSNQIQAQFKSREIAIAIFHLNLNSVALEIEI